MTSRHLRTRSAAIIAATALVTAGLAYGAAPQSASAVGYPRSERIAMVPDAGGRENHGGALPTSGFPNGYAPTFTSVSIESIRDDAVDPLASGYDTVVLNSVCDIDAFLSEPQFKSRVEGFVSSGGKLLIWDSECTSTDYSKFSIPFQTSNPGAAGAQGTLVDVEENTLSSKDPSSPNFVDVTAVASGTDAVGDANVFTTYDTRWFVDLRATNVLGVDGPVQAYANLGGGLVVYSGLDKDFLPGGSFDPAAPDGGSHLNRIWLLELLQPWNPDGLPNSTPATGSKPSEFIAMGDSFSAGEGNAPYISPSDTDLNTCHRSSVAYGPKLSELHWTHPMAPDFVACSGAITDDLYEPNREGNLIRNPVTGHYIREPEQMRVLSVDTKLVTLTVGGNDVGFGEVLMKCLVAKGDPNPHCQNTGLAKSVSNRIDALNGIGVGKTSTDYPIHSWVSIIREIHQKAPNARILIGGYPILINPDAIKGKDNGYCVIGQLTQIGFPVSKPVVLHKDEASWMKAKTQAVNGGIKQAVVNAGVAQASYVEVARAFQGHALCDSDPWIFPLSGTADGLGGTDAKYPWSGSFHPNAWGQMAYEGAFAKALG